MIRSLAVVVAALLVVWLAAAVHGQDEGPGYGPGPYGGGPYGPGPDGMDPDGPGGGRVGPRGMGPRGMGRGGPDDMDAGPYGMAPGGPPGGGGEESGPGGGGGGAGLSMATVRVKGVERPYYFHVPANVAKPAPLVLVFHGGGGRPQAIARKTGWNELADQNGSIVVYPEGSPAPSGRGGTWNVGNGEPTATSSDDKAYVAAILDDVRHHADIDPARIYAAGHSMGGIFAYRLACEMSGPFAAIGVVSSTMVEKHCKPSGPVAVLHLHGSADERIPLAGGRGPETARMRSWPPPKAGVATWAKLDACAPQPSRSTDGDMSCETWDHCRAEVQMCVRAGGVHQWPEGATSRIWAFFAAHPKVAQ